MPPAVSEQQPRCAQQTNCFLVLPQCQGAMGKVGKEGRRRRKVCPTPAEPKPMGLCVFKEQSWAHSTDCSQVFSPPPQVPGDY